MISVYYIFWFICITLSLCSNVLLTWTVCWRYYCSSGWWRLSTDFRFPHHNIWHTSWPSLCKIFIFYSPIYWQTYNRWLRQLYDCEPSMRTRKSNYICLFDRKHTCIYIWIHYIHVLVLELPPLHAAILAVIVKFEWSYFWIDLSIETILYQCKVSYVDLTL